MEEIFARVVQRIIKDKSYIYCLSSTCINSSIVSVDWVTSLSASGELRLTANCQSIKPPVWLSLRLSAA